MIVNVKDERKTCVCVGLHPSQQLTKYDGDPAAANDADAAGLRLSSQASGDSADTEHGELAPALSDPSADGAIYTRVKPRAPASDLAEASQEPSRVIGRRQAGAEESATNDQRASYEYEDQSLQDASARKPSLTGCQSLSVCY